MSNPITVIFREVTSPFPPVYPLPLIYNVEEWSSMDDILNALAEQRFYCFGERVVNGLTRGETIEAIAEGLEPLFAFEGTPEIAFDWR